MRKLALGLATAAVALAGPAAARDGATYLGFEGGLMFPQNFDYEVDGEAIEAEPDMGHDIDLLVGHDFGMFRLEGELGYKGFGIETLTTPSTTAIPGTGAGTIEVEGNHKIVSSMLNGLIDFGGEDSTGFSFGAGAGIAHVDAEVTAPGFVDDEDTGFAWQGLAAVRFPLSDRVDLGFKYRYFNVENIKLTDNFGRLAETDLESHSVLA